MNSENQKTGNCFYKNPEAACTFAWFVAHPENKKINPKYGKGSITPAGPINVQELHNTIIDNICDAIEIIYDNDKEIKQDLLEKIYYEKQIYEANKKFRKGIENLNGRRDNIKPDFRG